MFSSLQEQTFSLKSSQRVVAQCSCTTAVVMRWWGSSKRKNFLAFEWIINVVWKGISKGCFIHVFKDRSWEDFGNGKCPGSLIWFFLFPFGGGRARVQHRKARTSHAEVKNPGKELCMLLTQSTSLPPACCRLWAGVWIRLPCLPSLFAYFWRVTNAVWWMFFSFCCGFALLSYIPCIISCLWQSSFDHSLLPAEIEGESWTGW